MLPDITNHDKPSPMYVVDSYYVYLPSTHSLSSGSGPPDFGRLSASSLLCAWLVSVGSASGSRGGVWLWPGQTEDTVSPGHSSWFSLRPMLQSEQMRFNLGTSSGLLEREGAARFSTCNTCKILRCLPQGETALFFPVQISGQPRCLGTCPEGEQYGG